MKKWTVVITWWLGYLWSHVSIQLLNEWYQVALIDDLSNSDEYIVNRINNITWIFPDYYIQDIRETNKLEQIFWYYNDIKLVIHLASQRYPNPNNWDIFNYYDNDLLWSMSLFKAMQRFSLKNIIFWSSSQIYNNDLSTPPFSETHPVWSSDPLSSSKLTLEIILKDLAFLKWFKVLSLRLFDIIWVDKSWELDHVLQSPSNIFSCVYKMQKWRDIDLNIIKQYILNNDYKEYDYIDVDDVSKFILKLVNNFPEEKNIWEWYMDIINIGSWKWYSYELILYVLREELWIAIDLDDGFYWVNNWKSIISDNTKMLSMSSWITFTNINETFHKIKKILKNKWK